jgi:hypothetical protein
MLIAALFVSIALALWWSYDRFVVKLEADMERMDRELKKGVDYEDLS